jgi:hypothetical protein
MPRLDEPGSESPIKMLLLGNSGSGKTGSLASLARAGYQIHIIDFDNGTNILRNVLREDKAALGRIEVESFSDVYSTAGPRVYPSKVIAWAAAMKKITEWTNEYTTLDHILVIDSLNFASRAAFNWILQMANRLQTTKEIQDWGAAQDLMESFLMKIYSAEVKCHVIMTSHIHYIGQGETEIQVGYPMTSVGRSFAPKVPRLFNSCIMCRNTGTGAAAKREIYTQPIDFVDLKTESLDVKKSYPLSTGLAEYFFDVRKVKPTSAITENKYA